MIKKSIKKSPKKVYSPDFSKKKTVNIPLGMATTEYNEPNMPPLAFNPFVNIVGQTLLDQNDFGKGFNFSQSYSESLNNPNTPNDINTALELVKLNVPIVGDLVVNSLQKGISANTNKNRLRYGLPGNASQGPTKKALGGNNWFAPMVAPQFSLYGQFGQDTNQGMLQVPQFDNISKERNINIDATKYSMISPIVSSALESISGLSRSAPNKQNFNFYNQRASQNSINTDLYSTKQDLYGNQYFDKGGELKSLQSQYDSRNKSIAALQLLGDEDNDIVEALSYSNSLLTPKINKLQEAKTLEEIADYQQQLEEQSKLISQQSNQQAFYNYTPYRDTEDTQMFIDDGEYNSSYVPSPNIGFRATPLPSNKEQMSIIKNTALKYNVPPEILAGVYGAETAYGRHNTMVSSAGAQGPFQFMPATARQYGINPWDFNQASDGAARYLANSYKKTGNWEDAIASYNAGLGNVKRWRNIKETANYVPKVLANAQSLKGKFKDGGTFKDLLLQQNKPITDKGNFSNIPYTPTQQKTLQNVKQKEIELANNKLKQEQSARSAKEKGTKFQLPNGQNKSYKEMTIKEKGYVDGQILRNKGRWNENEVEQPFLNTFNPITMLYDMGAGLGEAPLMSDVTNSYIPYVTGVAAPLTTGALAGIGANTTGQFVNELINPLAGIRNPFKNKKFKSEIDWENWVKYKEDFHNNPEVIKHLNDIEEVSKANGTWMKNPDGSPFKGTPEQFVVQQSDNFKKMQGIINNEKNVPRINYHYSDKDFNIFDENFFKQGRFGKGIYTGLNPNLLNKSSIVRVNGLPPTDFTKRYSLYQRSTNPQTSYNDVYDRMAEVSKNIKKIYNIPYGKKIYSKKLKNYIEESNKLHNQSLGINPITKEFDSEHAIHTLKDNYTSLDINHPTDPNYEMVVPFSNYPKSAEGNILFDITNPDIYKAIVPAAIGVGALQKNKYGGQWLDQYQSKGEVKFRDQLLQQNRPITDKGNFSNIPYTVPQQKTLDNVRLKEKQIAQKQLENEKRARAVKDKNQPYTFPDGKSKTWEQMSDHEKGFINGQSLRNKGRWNENEVEQPFLNMFNPGTMLYDLAAGIGEAGYQSEQQNSILPYVTATGAPLLTGTLAGIGSKTTGQFINNLANPLAGIERPSFLRKSTGSNIPPQPQSWIPITLGGVDDIRRPLNGHAPGTPEWNRLNNILEEYSGGTDINRTLNETINIGPSRYPKNHNYNTNPILLSPNLSRKTSLKNTIKNPKKAIGQLRYNYERGALNPKSIYYNTFMDKLPGDNIGGHVLFGNAQAGFNGAMREAAYVEPGRMFGESSLSSDSFPLMLTQLRRKSKDVNIIPTGEFVPLNNMGNKSKSLLANAKNLEEGQEAILKNVNGHINKLNTEAGSKIPQAKIIDRRVHIPYILTERKGATLMDKLERNKTLGLYGASTAFLATAKPLMDYANGDFYDDIEKEAFERKSKKVSPFYKEFQNGGSFYDQLLQQNKPIIDANKLFVNKLLQQPQIDQVKKQEALAKQIANYDRTFSKTQSETPISKLKSKQLKASYVYNNPYSKLDEEGNITPIANDRDLQGVPKFGTQAYRTDDGIKNIMHGLDAAMLVEGIGHLGYKGLRNLGEYATTQTPLKNAYKLNPYRYQGSPNMMYRGLGEEGYKDALESGVFRAKQNVIPKYADNTKIQLNKQFNNTYYSPKFSTAENYGNGYIAEVPKDIAPFYKRYARQDWSQQTPINIPISEGKMYKKHWLQGYKEIPKPKTNFKSEINWGNWNKEIPENNIIKNSLPNPLQIADKIIPRPLAPGDLLGMGDSWNNYSPLNLIPAYGKKLIDKSSSYPNFVGFRKFGNNIDDVIESQSLRPNGSGMGSKQIKSEGNWAEPGKVNENYSGVFEATMNPQIPGSNIKLEKWGKRNGIVGTTKEGDVAIPLKDPGLSFNRRLPFSNRYVAINKQKLINKEFQLATQLPYLQSLAEKYAIWSGLGLGASYVGLPALHEANKKYIINPTIEKYKELDEKINETLNLPKWKNGGTINNNGMFDMTNPNIYKVLFPAAVGVGALQQNKFKKGGTMTQYNYGGMIQQLQQYQKGGSKQNPPRLKQPKNKTSKFI